MRLFRPTWSARGTFVLQQRNPWTLDVDITCQFENDICVLYCGLIVCFITFFHSPMCSAISVPVLPATTVVP